MLKKIPYIKGLPILGNLLSYQRDRLSFLSNLHSTQSEIFKVKIGSKDIIVPTKPDFIKNIMQTNFNSYHKITNLNKMFGDSLFTANGDDWKWQRAMTQALFTSKYLDVSVEDIKSITSSVTTKFIDESNENVRDFFSRITFSVIMKNKVGLNYNESFGLINDALFIITDYLTAEKYQIIKFPDKMNSRLKEFEKAIGLVDDLIYDSIDKSEARGGDESLIDKMIMLSKTDARVTKKSIRDNIITMIFAGYETSALTMTWLTYLFAHNPQWQQKCREEILDYEFDEIKLADLANMKNLDACINETLRLYPPGWAFTRTCVKESKLGEYDIKKGDIMLLSPYLLQRDSRYWKDPLSFRPERFFKENDEQLEKFAFFPFGAGPRTCVGMHFGMIEMKLILAYLLKRYEFQIEGVEPILDARATLFSKNGYNVSFKKIEA